MALAQPSIGGTDVPDGVYERGSYMFRPRPYIVTGSGDAVGVGAPSAVWRYEVMTQDQIDWWINTALAGGDSRETTFELWTNDTRTTVREFTSGVLQGPTWAEVQALPGGLYGPVEFRFDYLFPLDFDINNFTLGVSLLGGDDVLFGSVT